MTEAALWAKKLILQFSLTRVLLSVHCPAAQANPKCASRQMSIRSYKLGHGLFQDQCPDLERQWFKALDDFIQGWVSINSKSRLKTCSNSHKFTVHVESHWNRNRGGSASGDSWVCAGHCVQTPSFPGAHDGSSLPQTNKETTKMTHDLGRFLDPPRITCTMA